MLYRFVIFVLSAVLLAMSPVVLLIEISGRSGPMAAARVENLAGSSFGTGLSTSSQLEFLYDCRLAMNSVTGRAQPGSIRSALQRNCLSRSLEIASVAPTLSIAWYTSALAAAGSSDMSAFRTYLRNAYLTGRHEQWLAKLRVDLVSDHVADLNSELLNAYHADLILLLSEDSGRHFLAMRYVALSAFEQNIDLVLQQVAEADSQRFLNIAARRRLQKERQHTR